MPFTYSSDIKKETYTVSLQDGVGGSSFETYVSIGLLSEAPSLVTSAGEEIKVHTGQEIVISENVEFTAELIGGVNAANYTALKELINVDVDVKFVGDNTNTTVICTGMKVYPTYNATGNAMPMITLTGKKETVVGTGLAVTATA